MFQINDIVERIDGDGSIRYRITGLSHQDANWASFHRVRKNGLQDRREIPFSGGLHMFRVVDQLIKAPTSPASPARLDPAPEK
jgi:hypothetical protein